MAQKLQIDAALRFEELKDELLNYELATTGNNLVGTKCYEFLRHVLTLVWKELAAMTDEDVAAWRSGAKGATYPLRTNNVAHGTLLKMSERQRHEMAIPRKAGHAPLRNVDNLARTVRNWRMKTTEVWQFENGDTRKGFPFFQSWTRLDATGNPAPKGRGGLVGHIHLRWIFGPEWPFLQKNQSAKNQQLTESDREKISAIPPQTGKPSPLGQKKEDNRRPTDTHRVSAEPTTPDERPPEAGETPQGESPTLSAEIISPIPAAAPPPEPPGHAARRHAENIWALIFKYLYSPLFLTGRIRYSPDRIFESTEFRTYTQNRAIELLIENLHAARNEGETTLEPAFHRLREAVDAQAKYMADNPETWVLMPEKFLRTDRAHGTLLSALRVFVHEETRAIRPPEPPENETFEEKKRRLYDRLIAYGAVKVRPGVFARWCKEYGLEHIEACLAYTATQMQRRKAAGIGFDRNKGGASAYFASLVSRFDSKTILEEKARLERVELRRNIRAAVTPAHHPALQDFFTKLTEKIEVFEVVAAETARFFDLRWHDATNPVNAWENVALLNYYFHTHFSQEKQ